jgi:hypothetical protein
MESIMKLKITKAFQFAHRGVEVREYSEDAIVEADDADLVEISVREGWAVPADQADDEKKAKKGAPENKAKG